MTNVEIIQAARQMLPYTSEFDHDVIRVPVSNNCVSGATLYSLGQDNAFLFEKRFYEVEFKKQYVRNVAIGWEFVNIY